MCMFCRSLFVLLFLFFWPLCCLSFFDLPLWYLQALLGYICLVNMGRSSEWMISVYGEIYWMNKECTWGSLLVVPVRFAWRKWEYSLEITDLPQVTVKLYHMMCLFFFTCHGFETVETWKVFQAWRQKYESSRFKRNSLDRQQPGLNMQGYCMLIQEHLLPNQRYG